jgi:hypothetical protein
MSNNSIRDFIRDFTAKIKKSEIRKMILCFNDNHKIVDIPEDFIQKYSTLESLCNLYEDESLSQKDLKGLSVAISNKIEEYQNSLKDEVLKTFNLTKVNDAKFFMDGFIPTRIQQTHNIYLIAIGYDYDVNTPITQFEKYDSLKKILDTI